MIPARRDEDDGCQLVEEAVTARALSTRSCTKRPTSARCPRGIPISYTTRRRAGRLAVLAAFTATLRKAKEVLEMTSTSMNWRDSQYTGGIVECAACAVEVPLDEAVVPEATDRLIYLCGLECYASWIKGAIGSYPSQST